MTNDRHMQEHPSKGSCLSRVSPVVALPWTDYFQEEEEKPLREGPEVPIGE